MNSTFKSLLLWIVMIALAVFVWEALRGGRGERQELNFNEFLAAVEAGRVEEVTLREGELTGKYKPGEESIYGLQEFETKYPEYPELVDQLLQHEVLIHAEPPRENPLMAIFLTWGPVLLIVGLWIYFMRQFQAGGGKAMSFGKSKAKLFVSPGKRVTFDDVAGVELAEGELTEVVEFLKEPRRFQQLGGKLPKGVLLMGPPGTGKTLLARAIAGEANVPFFSISASSFVELFVGVGASRVRDLFEQGKKKAPCIIFIDEIDAVGRHRGPGRGQGNDEREQTLNQLLVEMDGFDTKEGVILIAATNRPDILDPALLRAGRFDRRIELNLPDSRGRLGILQVHTRTFPLADGVDLVKLAQQTWGFAGADLANLVNEAALIAARQYKKKVEMVDFETVFSKVRYGIRAKLVIEDSHEKWRIALHEAGHLSASFSFPCIQKLNSLSLYNLFQPEWFYQGELRVPAVVGAAVAEGTLVTLLAGRAAEEFFLNDVSSIGANDIAISTAFAYQMVARWGMGHSFGLINDCFLVDGAVGASSPTWSHFELFTQEAKRILDEAYATALQHVEENARQITEWASELVKEETLSSTWINKVRSSFEFRTNLRSANLIASSVQTGSESPPEGTANHPSIESIENDDLSSASKKLYALKRRRDVLELQVATHGTASAPAHIVTELEDVRKQIEKIEKDA